MFSIHYYNEADDSSSSSLSFKHNDSLYPLQFMEQQPDQSFNMMYTDFDWSMSSSSQPPPPQQNMSYWPHTMFTDPNYKHQHSPSYTYTRDTTSNRIHPRFKSANARLDSHYQQFLSPTLIEQPMPNDPLFDTNLTNETQFQFDIVLHAPTAVVKKHNEEQVTYLNRGQAYLMDFKSCLLNQSTLTSTISLAFHEPSHRVIAENYWKYWINQHEIPSEARAIELDVHQTTGVYNIRLTSFNQITFDWHSRFGAKVYIRFNCLSTDFSKIKGVKGIPMRTVVETTQQVMTIPHDITPYKGTFSTVSTDLYEYKESCFCKIKLFRDKGAERKNKDDKKQKERQVDKVIASTKGNPEQHPLWPILSQKQKSTSRFIEIPATPDMTPQELNEYDDLMLNLPLTKRKRTTSDQQQVYKPRQKSSVLTFYVWAVNFSSSPQEVVLETFTTKNLKSKLGKVLDIHPARISEILWRKKKTSQEETDVLVLVEDTFIAEHISDGEMMTVTWEMKTDGNLRLVLEF